MIFETHAHYDDEAFDNDRDMILNSLKDEGIEYVVNVGADIKSSEKTIELTKQYDFVYGAIGVHPSETAELDDNKINWLKEASQLPKIVAIGEIGLDYYWDTPDRSIQKKWFELQMELAKEVKLPAIIHSRDAAADTFDMIQSVKLDRVGGVIHCYSYSKEMAKRYVDMGFYHGIGGVVTFKNAKTLKEVVEYIPIEQLVLETDSPYLSPEPNRGKRNSSLNLKYIAKDIANIKGIDYEDVIEITKKNAIRMYHIQ